MKQNLRTTALAIVLGGTALWAAPAAVQAATQPATIAQFSAEQPTHTLNVRYKSWRDPAFGDMGWTHFSDWGSFQGTAGQTATLTLVSSNPDLHPGVTVWARCKADTAPDTYVTDHFYAQNAQQFELGAVDESTGQTVGNIVMQIKNYGYDLDGVAKASKVVGLHGVKDGVPGRLVRTFPIGRTCNYLFVVGGIAPGAGASDSTARYPVDVTLSLQ